MWDITAVLGDESRRVSLRSTPSQGAAYPSDTAAPTVPTDLHGVDEAPRGEWNYEDATSDIAAPVMWRGVLSDEGPSAPTRAPMTDFPPGA